MAITLILLAIVTPLLPLWPILWAASEPQVISTAAAFGELWPVLTTVGGGYLVLLGLIYKGMNDRQAERREDIALLRAENVGLRTTLGDIVTPLVAIADSVREMTRALQVYQDELTQSRQKSGD